MGQGGEDADGDGASDPSHGQRLGGRSHLCAWTGRGRGEYPRSTAWRATRPVSAAARDVAPDGPMLLRLCALYKRIYESFMMYMKSPPK